MEPVGSTELLELTVQVVCGHLNHNKINSDSLPGLIQTVYEALNNVGKVTAPVSQPIPAVPVKRSVFPEFIICLEDGKKLKMLKRHLHTNFGMTPVAYRQKWGLPKDYPMVAPNYAETRSTLAIAAGLGSKRRKPTLGQNSQDDNEPQGQPMFRAAIPSKAKRSSPEK